MDEKKTKKWALLSSKLEWNPTSHPLFMFVFSFVVVCLTSGLVYGWPALRSNLVSSDNESNNLLNENQLGAIFTVGSWTTQGGRLFAGISRDRIGTRITAVFCMIAAAGGLSGIAFAKSDDALAFAFSFFFVGLGSGAQICLQPVAGLFKNKWQGTILASLSGAFQVSGLIFLILTKISDDRRKSIGTFSLCLLILSIIAFFLLPKKHFPKREKNASSEDDESLVSGEKDQKLSNNERKHELEEGERQSGDDAGGPSPRERMGLEDDSLENIQAKATEKGDAVITSLEGGTSVSTEQSLKEPLTDEDDNNDKDSFLDNEAGVKETCDNKHPDEEHKNLCCLMKNSEYLLLLTWFSVQVIPLQYYVATIGFQLERKGDETGFYTSMFAVLYGSAFVFSPISGKLSDMKAVGLGISQALATTFTSLSLFFLSMEKISLNAQIIGMAAYGIGRLMVFGMYFSNIGKRFGYTHYGTLAGLGLLISAICSLLQYPLITIAADGREKIVNIICGVIMLVQGLPYCIWLSFREKKPEKRPGGLN